MASKKIGIITCSNCTQELDCCSSSCLEDLHERRGEFSRYPREEALYLGGMISCSGCPTIAYPEKILRKIKSLTDMGITDIHYANCMLFLCPYIKKYTKVILAAFPDVSLVEGTHVPHNTCGQFRVKVVEALNNGLKMSDIILRKI